MNTTNSSSLDCEGFIADVIDAGQQCVDLKSDLHREEDRWKEVFQHLKFILCEVLQLKKWIRSNTWEHREWNYQFT